jgi:hypothetical protein
MARHPDWFARLDSIQEILEHAEALEWLGRNEIKAIFTCSERDSIRLLHKFGAESRDNSLSLLRVHLLTQLQAIRCGSTYAAYLRQRHHVASHLAAARAHNGAREFRVPPATPPATAVSELDALPGSIAWRRTTAQGPARFQIVYSDGADLMRQLAQFLAAAGNHREEFFAATEPDDASVQ